MTEEEKFTATPNWTDALKDITQLQHQQNILLISGSVAMMIAKKSVADNPPHITTSDFVGINDIDVATNGFADKSTISTIHHISTQTNTPIEINPIFFNCTYPSSPVRDLAIRTATVILDNQTADLSYTTPEFLLLSLADQTPTDKSPQEKISRKIVDIQQSPSYSESNFLRLAQHELIIRREMNNQTFGLWKQNIIAQLSNDNFHETLRTASDSPRSKLRGII